MLRLRIHQSQHGNGIQAQISSRKNEHLPWQKKAELRSEFRLKASKNWYNPRIRNVRLVLFLMLQREIKKDTTTSWVLQEVTS
jgi:hypothetical protein